MAKKTQFMQWIDRQLEQDPEFNRQVQEVLNEMRIEQDLAALRTEREVSQAALARRLGVSQQAIAKIESGRVKNLELKTLVRYAAALGAGIKVEIVKNARPNKVVSLKTARAKA